jgi:hypothetical protein
MGTAILARRVYSYVPDTVLLLGGGSEFLRKIDVGNTWVKLRIGFLAALPPVDPVANRNMLAQRIYLGLSSSYGPGVTSFNCASFIGVCLTGDPTTDTTLTLTTNGYLPYYTGGNSVAFAKRGNVYTLASSSSSNIFSVSQRALPRRFAYVLDITRPLGGNGTYTINVYSSSSASHDWEPAALLDALDTLAAAPTIDGMTMTTTVSARTITWGETNGPLDTISIYSRLSNYPLEISAIGAAVQDVSDYSEGLSGHTEVFLPLNEGSVLFPTYWGYGTLLSGTLQPYYASSALTSSGSATNVIPYINVSGTSCGASDGFDSYGTGAFPAWNAGYGWTSAGTSYAW